jgi:CheY-like chemotaxis protein
LGSKHAGPRNVAKTILVGMGAPALPYLFHNLASEDDDLLVHTLNVIGLIGDASAGKHLRQLLFKSPKNANVRFAAYEALGFMNLQGGSFVLANGLEDEDEHVRTAAAKAIDKNLDDILNSGLRNLLREETPQTMAMVRLLIDSEAENVFRSLLDHPFFLQTSLAYLKGQAHPDVTKKFITLLQSMKRQDLVAQLVREEDSQDAEKTLVWAIDDSRMVLRLYRSMLHTLGVQCEVFEFPEQAIERLTAVQPAMIFTDLNMPKITGIDLTKAIRRSYSAEELPIVMVTTQNENEDHEAAQRSGVSGILQKPFTKDMLQNSMKQFLNL